MSCSNIDMHKLSSISGTFLYFVWFVGLIPASREGKGQTEVVEEQRVERRVEQENAQNHSEHLKHLDRRDVNPLVSSMDTEHQQTSQQMSSLSPGVSIFT